MLKNQYAGKFIVFEALDGSGASTQIELLAKSIEETSIRKVFITKEPTNNLIGGMIRGALTKEWHPSLECLQLLFAADRAHHLQMNIIPSLKEGMVVISDRYFLSTVAFGSLEIDMDWLQVLNSRFLLPDMTILLRVSPKECIRRIFHSRRFGFELFEEEQKLIKVWKAYEEVAKIHDKIYVVDGERPIEDVAAEIRKIVSEKLGLMSDKDQLVSEDQLNLKFGHK